MTVELEAEIEERLTRVRNVYVRTPEVSAAFALIQRTRKARRQNGGAYCSLVTGPSGCGKSRIFEIYRDREPAGDGVTKPIIMLTIPTPFTFIGFLDALLDAMGVASFANRQTVGEMLKRVLLYLDRFKVELILMEEASQIIDQKERTAKVPYWATDVIKVYLLDKAKVPVVMNGIPITKDLFVLNTQLETRRLGTEELSPYDLGDDVSRARFMLLCEVFEKAAGFPEVVVANNEVICQRIHRATGGIHGLMAKLFMEATDVGIRKGALAMDAGILALAHARIASPEKGWVNVFLMDVLPPKLAADETRVTTLHKRGPGSRKEAA